ncbi:pilus assembly protein PilM [Patescibacteria group bacterium]|nr:pilus assembly protein PilM [Patescibacteria group bacterium]
MAKNTIGIDISDFSIEAVAIDKSRGHFDIDAYSRFRLSPEIVDDGRILDKNRLKEAILKMLKNGQPHSMESYKKVALSVPESKIYSKVFTLPKNLKDKDLIRAASNKAEELFPENRASLVSAAKILKSNGEQREVFYSAAEIDIVYDLVKVFSELGIDIQFITSEAVSSFAGLDDEFKKNITLLLDIGARTTIASVFDDNGIYSSININIAGNNLTSAIAKKLNISHSTAEEKKRDIGLTPDGNGEIMLIIQGQFQPLIDELKRFITHFEDNSGKKIEQVVLVGGLAQMKGIDQYFGQNLNLPAYIGQPFVHSNLFKQGISPSKYINAIGLARLAQENTEIDFYSNLPKDKSSENDKTSKNNKSEDSSKDSGKKQAKKLKFNFKKIWLFLLMALLIVGALAIYIFKDNISGYFSKPVEEISVVPTEQASPVDNIQQTESMTRHIFVSNASRGDIDNFVLGEYFNIDFEYEILTDADYESSLDSLENQAGEAILPYLNQQYAREGYYIIPQVLSSSLISADPPAEEFVPGDTLKATIKFIFLMAKDEYILNILSNISQIDKEKIQLQGYQIFSYTIENGADLFDINVKFQGI